MTARLGDPCAPPTSCAPKPCFQSDLKPPGTCYTLSPRISCWGDPEQPCTCSILGHRGALTVQARETHACSTPAPRTVLPGLPGATQGVFHSRPQESTARVTQSNPVCAARGHRTILQVCCQRDLGNHPAMGAGTVQLIACQKALSPHRKSHTRGTVYLSLPHQASEAEN